MEHCPTCGARRQHASVCPRCQTDLQPILDIEKAACFYRRVALDVLEAGHPDDAFEYARSACDLHRSPESLKALALACLAGRRFPEALALWREYIQSVSTKGPAA